jgi:hypothetical protein
MLRASNNTMERQQVDDRTSNSDRDRLKATISRFMPIAMVEERDRRPRNTACDTPAADTVTHTCFFQLHDVLSVTSYEQIRQGCRAEAI